MSRLFVTGCTHFGHANIIRLAGRPFTDVGEMDARLIENWNATVRPNDEVWHLGDFAFRAAEAPDAILKRLNGRVHLMQGNHDRRSWGRDYAEIRHKGLRLVLFHYPIEEWNGWWRGALHLHAHTHSPELVNARREGKPNRFHVGVDATDFRPIDVEELAAMSAREGR